MNDKNWREWVFIYNVSIIILSPILVHIAMLFYAGGTIIWPGNSGYSLRYNFIGDLGFCTAHSGKPNTISCTLWFITAILSSSSFIVFAIAFPYFFTESKLEKLLSTIGSIILIILYIFTLIVVFVWNNMDPYVDLIATFVLIGNIAGPIIIPLYVIAIFHNKEFSNRLAGAWLIPYILSLIILVAGLLLVGPAVGPLTDNTTPEILTYYAISAHILWYVQLPCYFYVTYNLWKKAKS